MKSPCFVDSLGHPEDDDNEEESMQTDNDDKTTSEEIPEVESGDGNDISESMEEEWEEEEEGEEEVYLEQSGEDGDVEGSDDTHVESRDEPDEPEEEELETYATVAPEPGANAAKSKVRSMDKWA